MSPVRLSRVLRAFQVPILIIFTTLFFACESVPEFGPGVDDSGGDGDGDGDDEGDGDSNVNLGGNGPTPGDGDGDEPPPAVCGNGELEPGELCDDGNEEDDDGCSEDCADVDPRFDCSEPGEPCENTVICGSGIIEGDEVCDDGDTKSGDGCNADCSAVEEGYSCPKPGQDCILLPVCGNLERERGEQCDDGDEEDGDGCDENCQLEDGYFCPPGQSCILVECGDGYRTPGEQCDDDNLTDGDGCSKSCEVEEGWICSQSGCRGICGDGVVVQSEACDDGNTVTGDGCSAACRVEPFYDCDEDEPSNCSSQIVCGNGVLEPSEVCDPGISGHETCYGPGAGAQLACKAFDSGLVDPPVCGNGVVEYQEDCDDSATGTFVGCTACQIDPGYVCPAPGVCFLLPVCGDGILQAGERCDTGLLMSDPGAAGCDENCLVVDDFFCSGQPSVCVQSICGDGFRAPDEACDDGPGTVQAPGSPVGGDGCSATCAVETGWVCPPGIACQPVCGNGNVDGSEQCDVTNSAACVNCRLQPGYTCGPDGEGPCTATVCGNAVHANPNNVSLSAAIAAAEPGEGCDDGNKIAGDGCGPTCQIEPGFTRTAKPGHPTGYIPGVQGLKCGDGLKTGNEECDDGNEVSGDGCSNGCLVEAGWYCDPVLQRDPSIEMSVTYRDFKSSAATGGHPHFQNVNADNKGIAGSPCTTDNQNSCGMLDVDGKPRKASGSFSSITGGSETEQRRRYGLWYRNATQNSADSSIQIAVVPDKLTLTQDNNNPDVYRYRSSAHFPLNGRGHGNTCNGEISGGCCNDSCANRNFGFTTELRYFFQYQGGETLTFRGDDDVWVFINGHLAVDVGGVHCAQAGRVVLGDEDSDCSVHGGDYHGDCSNAGNPPACSLEPGEITDNTDGRFGLTKGGIYEIVLFHAERHTSASNFDLTLQGFLAPRSFCETDCGDDIRAGNELCDGADVPASAHDGYCVPEGQPGECTFEFCGDGLDNGEEECDDGENSDLYGTGCAPGCVLPPKCGDGELQVNFDEQCDRGAGQNNGGYGGCTSTCQLGPYCGDGSTTHGEACDCGGNASCDFTTYGDGPGECNFNCTTAPYCGDDVRNGTEICDGSSGCNDICEFDPFCGDGLKTVDEQCDYGQFASPGSPQDAPYGGCTDQCLLGPYCGDGSAQGMFGEECDLGAENQDNVYDGCTKACLWGPRCGDGIHQAGAGEACDNGFNEDDYAYSGSACGPDCTPVPSCGDGVIQSAFELCDNGVSNDDDAYNGCTTDCEWGPYCGDGKVDPEEQCDQGKNNTAYSAKGSGCGYDCRPAPSCGDGVRNGPEQCDDGADDNTGGYGKCKENCTLGPYCGDRTTQRNQGEQCDDGPSGSLACSPTCKTREVITR